jgi:hypothetical protein
MTLKLTYGGFNYVADVDGSYGTSSLSTMISQTASNSVALTADYGIDAANNTVYADYSGGGSTGSTETTAGLKAEALAAENAGLSVVIRPLIDFLPDASAATLTSNGNTYADGDWRAYYNPGSVANGIAFLQSYYTTVLAPLAQAAQDVGAAVFDIGTEMDQLTGPAYQSTWDTIITEIKSIYTGKLTYSAIGDDNLSSWQYGNFADANITNPPGAGTGDIGTQVSFWNNLDYVGIDEYSALSDDDDTAKNGSDPTLQDLVNAWEQPFTDDGNGTPTDTTAQQTNGQSLIDYYESIATETGKPLLFTELGYNSAPDAASQPFFTSDTSSSSYDPALQAELYQAFFQAWQADGNTSLKGLWFWNWEPDPSSVGAGTDPSWTPQDNTAALADTKAAFTAVVTCYYPGTGIRTPSGDVAVEDLAIGDTVLTADGRALPVRWIGHNTVSTRFADPLRVLPIRIRAGALADSLPERDLLVSAEHALLVEDILVQAGALVNGISVIREADVPETFTYYHVELAEHALILAEGAPAETFVDNVHRSAFDNWEEHEALYGAAPIAEMAYPRAQSHRQVPPAIRDRLMARSGPTGPRDTTREAMRDAMTQAA